MKMLPRQQVPAAKEEKDAEGGEIERQLGHGSGPAGNAGVIDHREPVRGFTGDAEAASVGETSQAPEGDSQGRDGGEAVAGGFSKADQGFHRLDSGVAADQGTDHGFSAGQLIPEIGMPPVQPPLRDEIADFCPGKGPDDGSGKDLNQSRIGTKAP